MLDMPSINFADGVLSADRLQSYFQSLSSYIQTNIKLLSNNGYGVVDANNPGTRVGSELKPLWVSYVDPTHYLVFQGVAVTQNGDVLFQETSETVVLADTSGKLNLVALTYDVVSSGDTSLTTTNQMVATGTIGRTTLSVLTLDQYISLSDTVKQRTVVLAGIAYSSESTGSVNTNVEINAPTTKYPFIRTWFSFSDVEHRSMIGSGDVTSANPHGTGFGDITVGGWTLYDHFTNSGLLLSKSSSIPGVPGYYCQDDFVTASVKTDLTGATTNTSFFGGTNVYYVELSGVPNTICYAQDTTLDLPIGVDNIAGTNIVILYCKVVPTTFRVGYTKSPSIAIASHTASSVVFSSITNNELLVSNGKPVTSLAQTGFQLRKYGPIPRNVTVFVDDSGFLVGDPGVINSVVLITDNTGENLLSVSYTPTVPVYIGVGCHGLGSTPGYSVSFFVSGTDVDGNSVSERLDFNSDTWSDTVITPALQENDNQVVFTTTAFATVTSVIIPASSVVSIQSSAVALVYSKLVPAKHRYSSVARGLWNGRELVALRDTRRVLTTVRDGQFGITPFTAAAEIILGANELVSGTLLSTNTYKRVTLICAEDFAQPRYLDSPTVIWEGNTLSCPALSNKVVDSSRTKNCYRSRMLPLRKYDSDLCGFVVILSNPVVNTVGSGSVRVIMKNDASDLVEGILLPMKNDLSGRIYIGYTSVNYRSAGFLVTGTCDGLAAYFVSSSNIDPYYAIQVKAR